MKPLRVAFYGNFGAGNLGNECTLQAVIEQVKLHRPDAQMVCICTGPEDVQKRHGIPAIRSAVGAAASTPAEMVQQIAAPADDSKPEVADLRRRGPLARALRLVFRRLPLELAHWLKMIRTVKNTDLLIVAGTGIVADYMCGPYSWPYDLFKLGVIATLCRTKLIYLSVGVGPIRHSISRAFIKTSLRLATYRSYRDIGSKKYLDDIGFDTSRDIVYPDVVFGLSPQHLPAGDAHGARRIIGLGLKDYSPTDRAVTNTYVTDPYWQYLELMAKFVSWLQQSGFAVRLLIGDFQFDTRARQDFIEVLKKNGMPTEPPLLLSEPVFTVAKLLQQIADVDMVLSPRYHNLVLALMLNKPVMALSDHAKLDSLLTDLQLAQYRIPLDGLNLDTLRERFKQLDADTARVKPYIAREVQSYRLTLDRQYDAILT